MRFGPNLINLFKVTTRKWTISIWLRTTVNKHSTQVFRQIFSRHWSKIYIFFLANQPESPCDKSKRRHEFQPKALPYPCGTRGEHGRAPSALVATENSNKQAKWHRPLEKSFWKHHSSYNFIQIKTCTRGLFQAVGDVLHSTGTKKYRSWAK